MSEEFDIEKFLYKDAEKIEIDQEFKRNLKMRTMGKKKNHFLYDHSYLKIASVFVAVTIFGGSLAMVVKQQGNLQREVAQKNQTDAMKSLLLNPSDLQLNQAVKYDKEANTISQTQSKEVAKVMDPKADSKNENVNTNQNKNSNVEVASNRANQTPKATVGKEETASNPIEKAPLSSDTEKIVANAKTDKDTGKDATKSGEENGTAINKLASADKADANKAATSKTADGNEVQKNTAAVAKTTVSAINLLEVEKVSALPEGCVSSKNYGEEKLVPYIIEQIEKAPDKSQEVAKQLTIEQHFIEIGITVTPSNSKYVLMKLGPLENGKYVMENVLWSKDGNVIYVVQNNGEKGNKEILKLTMEIK